MGKLNPGLAHLGGASTDEYSAAAIQFHDGIIVDVARIHGCSEYVSAMKELAEDTQKVRTGTKSSL